MTYPAAERAAIEATYKGESPGSRYAGAKGRHYSSLDARGIGAAQLSATTSAAWPPT